MFTPSDTLHISSLPTILLHRLVSSGNSSHQTVLQLRRGVGNGDIHTAPSTYVREKKKIHDCDGGCSGGHRSKAKSLSIVLQVGVRDPSSETAVSADSGVAMPHPESYSRLNPGLR